MAVGWDGRMSEAAGDLAGLTQKEAGARVIAWAEERGHVEKREPYRHSVGTCERCHSRIEPLISLQWWCAMERARGTRDLGAAGAPRSLPPGVAASLRHHIARGDARLVHLAAALVGPSAPDLDLS